MSHKKSIPFLSASWNKLIVVNYEIRPSVLAPLVPPGTQLDFHQNKTFVSLVGFLFRKTRLFGFLPIWPFGDFEEVNLRFYVVRKVGREYRRAVCFIKEIVPFWPISWCARSLYNEPYVTYPTRNINSKDICGYEWKSKKWMGLKAQLKDTPIKMKKGSLEDFILEHYWGYTVQKDGSVREYKVEHQPWKYWNLQKIRVSPEVDSFYGDRIGPFLKKKPHSSFVAEGSSVKVYLGERIEF